MERNMNIFLSSEDTIEQLAQIIKDKLGIELEPVHDRDYIFYKFHADDDVWLNIGVHDLEDDRDLKFKRYQYQIEIGASSPLSYNERLTKSQDFAKEIFEQLKAVGKYSMMLVEDVQKKIDEFKPEY